MALVKYADPADRFFSKAARLPVEMAGWWLTMGEGGGGEGDCYLKGLLPHESESPPQSAAPVPLGCSRCSEKFSPRCYRTRVSRLASFLLQ